MKSAITKSGIEFTSTGTMWKSIYDERFDEKTREEMLLTEMKLSYDGKDSIVIAAAKSKKDYLLMQNPMVKGLLNTNQVTWIRPKDNKLVMMTAFPELITKATVKVKLTEVTEYKSGFEGGLTVSVMSDAKGVNDMSRILHFFDTRYIQNCDKYKLGEIYNFHIGALVTQITHRSSKFLNLRLSEKARQTMKRYVDTDQKTISSKHMFALNTMYDDNPEVFSAYLSFTGLHTTSYHYPLLTKKEEMYLFEIRCQFFDDEQIVYTLPALMTDGVIVQSYKKDAKNKRRRLEFKEGDPVDIVGVLQGHLAAE